MPHTRSQTHVQKSAKKFAPPMTTMSQADSYFMETKPRVSKRNIFGDPWAASKARNKNLIAEIMKGNDEEDAQRLFEQATIIFNENPHRGIAFCIDSQLFSRRASSIAKFLWNTSGLSKFAIGQYLGSPDEMNQ